MLTLSVSVPTSNVRNPMRDAKLARAELNSATASRNSVSTFAHSSSPLMILAAILPMEIS
jgi:hypothetical protein